MSDQLVQTVPDSASNLQPVDVMIDLVAAIIGGQDDPDARTLALRCLDRAADRMNMAGVFGFRHAEASYTTFTAAQETLVAPDDWAFPCDPAAVYDSAGNVIQVLEWKLWDVFRQAGSSATGRPEILSQASERDLTIYVAPKIDPAAVYQIRLSYLARVQRPSEATTLYLLPETREALITGGEAFITRSHYLKYPNIWSPMFVDFDRTIRGAIAASLRWTEATRMAAIPDINGSLARVTPEHFYGNRLV